MILLWFLTPPFLENDDVIYEWPKKMEGAEDESSPILSFLLPDEFDVCENDMVPGFMAGDIRVNENPGKVSIVIKVMIS